MTLTVGDDASVHYVATDARFRRQGPASRLIEHVLASAVQAGARTATLQASADGLPVWERLGFRRLALLRGFVRVP